MNAMGQVDETSNEHMFRTVELSLQSVNAMLYSTPKRPLCDNSQGEVNHFVMRFRLENHSPGLNRRPYANEILKRCANKKGLFFTLFYCTNNECSTSHMLHMLGNRVFFLFTFKDMRICSLATFSAETNVYHVCHKLT